MIVVISSLVMTTCSQPRKKFPNIRILVGSSKFESLTLYSTSGDASILPLETTTDETTLRKYSLEQCHKLGSFKKKSIPKGISSTQMKQFPVGFRWALQLPIDTIRSRSRSASTCWLVHLYKTYHKREVESIVYCWIWLTKQILPGFSLFN